MNKPIVRLVTIEPMQWFYVNAVGKTPEIQAIKKLLAWAEALDLLRDPARTFLFGRNNPPPSPNRDEYGYDFGLILDPEAEIDSAMRSELLSRGPYAVTRTSLVGIEQAWATLYRWVDANGYAVAGSGLEEHLTPFTESNLIGMLLDLWLPVSEAES